VWTDAEPGENRVTVRERRVHELEVSRGAHRQVEAVEESIHDVPEERGGLLGRRAILRRGSVCLEEVTGGERHPSAESVRSVPEWDAQQAGDTDPPNGDPGEAVGKAKAGCTR
jgi:hypothetical protein